MRLYNAASCTPWVANTKASPPKNFLPDQSDGCELWQSSKDQLRTVKRSFKMSVPSKYSTGTSQNCMAPIGLSESTSPNTTTYTADLTTEIFPPSSKSSPLQKSKMAEEDLLDTLPALRDLDDILKRVNLLSGERQEAESDASSLTTLSTLSTKGSIDAPPAPLNEFYFGVDFPGKLVEKCPAASPFRGDDNLRWASTKAPSVHVRCELPWPDQQIQDYSMRSIDRSPTKLCAEEAEAQIKETFMYTDVRAGLRKVGTKISPSKQAVKISNFPTQEAKWARNETSQPSPKLFRRMPPRLDFKETHQPSQDPFCRSMSPRVEFEETTKPSQEPFSQIMLPRVGFHPFESPSKATTPIVFDNALSLTQHLKSDTQVEAHRENPLHSSSTPEISNLRERWNENDNRFTPGDTKKVPFRMPDGPSMSPLSCVQVTTPERDEKRIASVAVQGDPKYAKYFRMLKMGLPMGAVKNALKMDGQDPAILDGDTAAPAKARRPRAIPGQALSEKVRHFRIHWETHSDIRSNSVWAMVKRDPDVSNLQVDEQEVKKLFRCDASSQHRPSTVTSSRVNGYAAVKVIDSKRANNGGITLARVRQTYNEIARAVDCFDQDAMTAEQIRGIIHYIPTQDERAALRVYLEKDGRSKTQLCECEKFMVAMMGVKHAKRKLSAIQFMQSFASCLEDLRRDARLVQKACEEIMSSSRFRKILGIILVLGNRLNTAGDNGKEPARAITLDSLLKLDQAKSFDRQTTFLHFIVTSIRRNKASLIHYKDDLPAVFKVEKMQWSLVMSEMQRMEKGIDEVRKIALHYSQIQAGLAVDDAVTLSTSNMPLAREVELLQTTSVGRFTLEACLRMAVLVNEVDNTNDTCDALFQYFGDQQKTQSQPDLVFRTVCKFGRNFDRALDEVIAQEKAKIREMRGVPIVRCATKSFDEGDGDGVENARLQALRNKGGSGGSTVLSDHKRSSIKARGKFRWRRRKF